MTTPVQAHEAVEHTAGDGVDMSGGDTPAHDTGAENDATKRIDDHNIIELAIERALNGVKAELEATTAAMREEAAASDAGRSGEAPTPKEEPAHEPAAEDRSAAAPVVGAGEVTLRSAPKMPAATSAPKESGNGARTTATSAPDTSSEADSGTEKPQSGQAVQPLGQILARLGPPATLEDLNRAVGASGGRPLDTILEGIMRPIVREWLANNLPSLAERLVREEIERISRRHR